MSGNTTTVGIKINFDTSEVISAVQDALSGVGKIAQAISESEALSAKLGGRAKDILGQIVDTSSAYDKLIGSINKYKESAEQAAAKNESFIASALNNAANIVGVVDSALGMAEASSGMFELLVGVLGKVPGPVGAIVTVLGGLAAVVYANRDSVVDLGSTHATVSEVLQATWQSVSETLQTLWSGITETAKDAWDGLVGMFKAGLGWISDKLGLSAVNWGDLFSSVFSAVLTAGKNFFNGIIGFFVGIGDFVGNTAGFISTTFMKNLGNVSNMISALMSDIRAALSGDFSFTNFKNALSKGFDDVKDSWGQYVDSMKGSLDKALGTDYVGNAADAIKNKVAVKVMANRQKIADQQADDLFNSAPTTEGNGAPSADKKNQQLKCTSDAAQCKSSTDCVKQIQNVATAQDSVAQATQKGTDGIAAQTQKQQDQNAVMGLAQEALTALEQGRIDDAIAINEQYASTRSLAGASDEEIQSIQKQTDALFKLKEQRNASNENKPKTASEQAKQNVADKEASKVIDIWKKAGDDIEQSLTNALMNGFKNGKELGKNLRDTLKNAFKNTVLEVGVKPIMQGIKGAILGAIGIPGYANAAGSGGGTDILGSISNISSIYNMGTSVLGGGIFGSSAAYGLATGTSGMQAAMLASQTAEFGAAGLAATAEAGGTLGGSMMSGLASMGPWGWAAMAVMALLASGVFKQKANVWDAVEVNPDEALSGRIKETHGKDALAKTESGLNLGATWKRSDGSQSKAAMAAMQGIDATLFGLTNADMTGKLTGTYGYNKRFGGYLAGSSSKVVGSMDEVIAQFTRDWVEAAGDSVAALNKGLVSTVTGSAEEVLKKTVVILSMKQADMDKLFGESVTVDKFKAVAKEGEGAGDALVRLAPIFQATGNLAKIMGADLTKAFGGMGLASTKARENVVKNAGGADALNSQLGTYRDLYFDDAEKLKMATEDVAGQFDKLGMAMPEDKKGYRAMMEKMANSDLLATEAGAKLYAELLKLAPAFAAVADGAEAAKQAAIKDAQANVDAARADLQEAYNREASALQQTIDKMSSFAKAIKQFREGLLLGEQSPLSPEQKYAEARRQFEDVSRRAALGDTEAMDQLQGASQSFLEASRAYNASNTQYASDFSLVQSSLSQAEAVATRQASIADQQLVELKKQVDGLLNIDTSVKSVADAIKELKTALENLKDANNLGKKPTEVTEKNVNGVWTSTGGAKYDSSTGMITGKTGNTYTATSAIDWVNEQVTNQDGLSIYQAANKEGVSANSLDVMMGWEPGTSNKWAEANGLPKFASGGRHFGGLRLVGERGPEIEATGPSRIWNAEQTRDFLSGGGNNEALTELRSVVTEIRASRQTQVDVGNKLDDRLATIERRLDAIENENRLRSAA